MKLKSSDILTVALASGSQKIPVGRLALKDRDILFEYDRTFISKGLELSPFHLPARAGIFSSEKNNFDGLYGLFNDSLPDGWGRLLLDRQMQSKGILPQSLTALDRLSYVGRNGMGALIYEPGDDVARASQRELDLCYLAQESSKILNGGAATILDELLLLNGSSAGARPKIMAGVSGDKTSIRHGQTELPDGYEHWLIKFASAGDQEECGEIEYAYSLMAKAAGIEFPDTHLFHSTDKKKTGYFGVKRFDRCRNDRVHMHTVSGLLQSDHRDCALDYETILKAAFVLTKSMPQVEALFRQAVFNVFTHNRDDHAKNFAFLMQENGDWVASPAYDLTFSSGPNGQHSTTVMGEGLEPGISHLKKLAQKFGIKKSGEIIDQVRDAVAGWERFADEARVGQETRNRLGQMFSRLMK